MAGQNLAGMRETGNEVIRLYDRQRHRDHAYFFGGHDSRVCARSFVALGQWCLGFPEQARREAWACIEDGRALGHAFSHAHGLNMGSITFLMLDDADACRAVADELYPLAERNKFSWPLAQARFLRGWLAARDGGSDRAIDEMMQMAMPAGTAVFYPVLQGLIAAHQIRTGRHDAATITLDRASEDVAERAPFYEGEIARLRGENLLAQSRSNLAPAEDSFPTGHRACGEARVPRAQTARSHKRGKIAWRYRPQGGRPRRAAAAYSEFTEGFEIPDLRAAKALLAELN